MSTVNHHGIFQVYIPQSKHDWQDASELLMTEAYLMYNGEFTPNYTYDDSGRQNFQVLLMPSFIYLSNKIYTTPKEKYDFINDCIDSKFIEMLLWMKPIYKSTDFIDLHFTLHQGSKETFIKHIKFEIIPKIKRCLEDPTFLIANAYAESVDFNNIKDIIMDWIESKDERAREKTTGNNTTIGNAENVIVNNSSDIGSQKNSVRKGKSKYAQLGVLIALLSLVLALIVNWDKIF